MPRVEVAWAAALHPFRSSREVFSLLGCVLSVLKALIERESARRLAQLGGTEPQLQAVLRRQSKHGRRSAEK